MKLALNIGINKYSRRVYGGNADLNGAVNDSRYMVKLATAYGFDSTTFFDRSAITIGFKEWLITASKNALFGDTVMVTFSGHGTRANIDGQEQNALAFHDGLLWDYEIKEILSKFKKGVNVIWIMDCCFSEENFKFVFRQNGKVKSLDFENIKKLVPTNVTWQKSEAIQCNFIQYASSSQFQVSYDLGKNGLFTNALREAYNLFPDSNYYKIFKETERIMSKTGYPQTPKFVVINGNDVKPNGLTFKKFLT